MGRTQLAGSGSQTADQCLNGRFDSLAVGRARAHTLGSRKALPLRLHLLVGLITPIEWRLLQGFSSQGLHARTNRVRIESGFLQSGIKFFRSLWIDFVKKLPYPFE